MLNCAVESYLENLRFLTLGCFPFLYRSAAIVVLINALFFSFTIGSYSLVEPDGSIRTVDYVSIYYFLNCSVDWNVSYKTADDINGFNAVVSKTAPTVHSAAVHTPVVKQQVIAAPAPIHVEPLAHQAVHQPIYSGVQHVSSPIVQVAPQVYKQPYGKLH